MVAEQTAADNGAHSGVDQRTQLTAGEGVGHGNGDGDADGEGAPGGAGEEGDHGARDEGHRQEQGGVIQLSQTPSRKSAAPMDLVMVLMQ